MRLARPSEADLASRFGEIAVHQLFDLQLDVVGQLVAVRAEQLDAVVVVRIVRGRDHHAEVGAHRAGQHGDRRRRHRAGQQHVHADRGEAGHHRVFDHVAGEAGVLADQHTVAMVAVAEHQAGGLAHLERKLRRDRGVGAATNAVGSEMLADHTPHRTRIDAVLRACPDRLVGQAYSLFLENTPSRAAQEAPDGMAFVVRI